MLCSSYAFRPLARANLSLHIFFVAMKLTSAVLDATSGVKDEKEEAPAAQAFQDDSSSGSSSDGEAGDPGAQTLARSLCAAAAPATSECRGNCTNKHRQTSSDYAGAPRLGAGNADFQG